PGFEVPAVWPSNGSATRRLLSGRALTRRPVGSGGESTAFAVGLSPAPVATFSAALPRIPYGGGSPVRPPAPGPSQLGRAPFRRGRQLKPHPDMPCPRAGLPTPSRAPPPEGNPPQRAEPGFQ